MPRANSRSRAGQGAQDLHPADDPPRSSLSITALSTPVRGMIRPQPTVVPVTDRYSDDGSRSKIGVDTEVIMWIMTSRIAVLALDAQQPRVVADFWCAVLGWEVIEVDEDGVSIAPPDRAWPAIDGLPYRNAKPVKNRLHLDLRADGSGTDEELQRLLSLGAQRVHVGQGPDVSWVVLADPEGNEFCLLARSVQQL